jgi:hypothetical protein
MPQARADRLGSCSTRTLAAYRTPAPSPPSRAMVRALLRQNLSSRPRSLRPTGGAPRPERQSGLEGVPAGSVALSDGRSPRERAHSRRSVRSRRLQSSQAPKRRTGILVPRCSRPSVQRVRFAVVAVDVDRAARHRRAGVQYVSGAALLVCRPGDLLRCATSRRRLSRSPLPSASSHFGPRSRSRGRCR